MRLLVPGRLPLLLLALATLAAGAHAQGFRHRQSPAVRARGLVLVSGFHSDAIHVYEAATGEFRKVIAPVPGAQSIRPGPDGLLYVCAEKDDEILRVDPELLVLVDAFVADDPLTMEDETGGLDGPTSACFGPDGNLYVASFNSDSVLRYDGTTGAFLDVFVASGLGGLDGPDAGTCFGPDGHLYVPSFWNHSVQRYDGCSGAHMGPFVDTSTPGTLRQPRDLKFRDGVLFVASSQNHRILRYDSSGNFLDLDQFAAMSTPYSIAFHPDDGHLYGVSLNQDNVRLFDGVSGELLRLLFDRNAGGLDGATYLAFVARRR